MNDSTKSDAGPAAPAPLPVSQRSIKQAGWGEVVETGDRLYRAVITLPHHLGDELARAAQDFYDAMGRAAEAKWPNGIGEPTVGAAHRGAPEPSEAALQAAVDSFAFRDTSKMTGNGGPWVPHHIVDAVRAAYRVDAVGGIAPAPEYPTKDSYEAAAATVWRLRGWLDRIVTAAGDADYLRDLAHMALDGKDPKAFEPVVREPAPAPEPRQFVGVDQGPDQCWFACISSLTGIPLGDFPPPPTPDRESEVHNLVTKLLHERGWQMHRIWTIPDAVPRGWAIAGGTSPRQQSHAVVVYDGVMIWDPHPSRAGLLTLESYEILVPVRAGNMLPRAPR